MDKKKPVYKWIAVSKEVGESLRELAAKQRKTIRHVAEKAILKHIDNENKKNE